MAHVQPSCADFRLWSLGLDRLCPNSGTGRLRLMQTDMKTDDAARALWIEGPGKACHAAAQLGSGHLYAARYSAISRGTERLVLAGAIPPAEHDRMRAPHQEGNFPFPVKYGYSMVAEGQDGPHKGQLVFALFPHQDRFRLADDSVLPLPEGLDPRRAVLAANMETALNIVWDSGVSAGDRVAVIGAGVVGALVGYLCARIPGAEVTLCDIDPARARIAADFGCDFAQPSALADNYDVIVNASASSNGLAQALESTGPGGTVVEASWHGENNVALPLGGRFHSQRLRLVSSQVGGLPPDRLARWTYRRRLAKALDLLRDDRLDVLLSGESRFATLPDDYAKLIADPATLCHRICYP